MTDMTKLLAIKWPNEERLDIQVRDRLCDYQWAHSPPSDEELSGSFKAFRDKLRAVHGIDKIDIGKHVIHVGRYEIFDWEELVPQMAEIISAFTGSTYEIVWDDRRKTYGREPVDFRDYDDAA